LIVELRHISASALNNFNLTLRSSFEILALSLQIIFKWFVHLNEKAKTKPSKLKATAGKNL
jgi:hypothetical protein